MQTAGNPCLTGRNEFDGQEVRYVAPDGVRVTSYLAAPKGSGARPAVVVIHENRGLVPYVRDVVDGLASEGFLALAPDLLTREGGTSNFSNDEVPGVLGAIPRERHAGDVQAAVEYLKQRGDVGKIGVMGFCFGGGVTWLSATRVNGVDAWAPFYGVNPPLDDAPRIKGRVLAVYAEQDERINAGLPAIREALQRAGIQHEIQVYPNSQHAFHNHQNRERHNPDTARQAWQAVVGFLRTQLA